MTNGDHIRKMTDEELAKTIDRAAITQCPPGGDCTGKKNYECTTCWLDWIREETADE